MYNCTNGVRFTHIINQCLTETPSGLLIQISSYQQFNVLKTVNIDGEFAYWLGANNFVSCKLYKTFIKFNR